MLEEYTIFDNAQHDNNTFSLLKCTDMKLLLNEHTNISHECIELFIFQTKATKNESHT